MSRAISDSARARDGGDFETRLAHPLIDLSKCMGCGTCVEVCPESGVLDLVHGQAVVVRGSACKGIAACEAECPVGAVRVAVANAGSRSDLPRLEQLEVPGRPGLFLIGEVTGQGSIRLAFEQGVQAGESIMAHLAAAVPSKRSSVVSKDLAVVSTVGPVQVGHQERQAQVSHCGPDLRHAQQATGDSKFDLVIVGAGPAGLACALSAKEAGVHFLWVDQADTVGGAIANYPKRKLVLTNPVRLPLSTKLRARAYSKEELLTKWKGLTAQHELPLRTGLRLSSVTYHGPSAVLPGRTDPGPLEYSLALEGVGTGGAGEREVSAHAVCLALGRAGSPRKLGVAGEHLAKVAYGVEDADDIFGQRIAVVGGGLSAVEAALALSAERRDGKGNVVTLIHRRNGFTRLTSDMERAVLDAAASGRIQLRYNTKISRVEPDFVGLSPSDSTGEGALQEQLPNDLVYILVGGVPSIGLLTQAGVDFTGAKLKITPEPKSPKKGYLRSRLWIAFCFGAPLLTLYLFRDYYALAAKARPEHLLHDWLRPGAGLGLMAGLVSVGLILANLAYLPRRSAPPNLRIGSLASWMRVHVVTGFLVPVLVFVHAAAAPRETVGGHGFWTLVALVVTGTIGRYFYSVLPRATNGAELAQADVKRRLSEATRGLGGDADDYAAEALALVGERQWGSSFAGRLWGLIGSKRDLRAFERKIRQDWSGEASSTDLDELVELTRVAWRRALLLAHLEDLRALASSWRYFHRWIALLMVVLVGLHIAHASAFGGVLDELGRLFDFGVRIK